LWKTHKIRIRGSDLHKLRLSTPYWLQKKTLARASTRLDEHKRDKPRYVVMWI
jgi:hypothetical protein